MASEHDNDPPTDPGALRERTWDPESGTWKDKGELPFVPDPGVTYPAIYAKDIGWEIEPRKPRGEGPDFDFPDLGPDPLTDSDGEIVPQPVAPGPERVPILAVVVVCMATLGLGFVIGLWVI